MTNDNDNNNANIENEVIETLDFNKPSFIFTPKGRHTYRQEGGYLVCKSCELHHAIYIGMDKIMVGETSEGEPILKERSEV